MFERVSGSFTRFLFRHLRIRSEVRCKPGPDRSVTHAREAERDPFYFIFSEYVRARLRLEVKVKVMDIGTAGHSVGPSLRLTVHRVFDKRFIPARTEPSVLPSTSLSP